MSMVRDANKPPVRGKTSPYGFFVKMCYEEHKKKYPNENVQVTEISKKCSEKWKTMTDDEKRRFFELAQKDAERYTAEIAAYGGEDAMRKRKRAKKDPNAPKRALSAFFFFSHVKRGEVQGAHTEWKVGQVAQELGRMWKALTEDEKKVYEKMATDDKARYEVEMRDYKGGTYKPVIKPTGGIAGRTYPGFTGTKCVLLNNLQRPCSPETHVLAAGSSAAAVAPMQQPPHMQQMLQQQSVPPHMLNTPGAQQQQQPNSGQQQQMNPQLMAQQMQMMQQQQMAQQMQQMQAQMQQQNHMQRTPNSNSAGGTSMQQHDDDDEDEDDEDVGDE